MISIITATFNSAKTLKDTIQSVLRQTNKDFEYLIIDGGSTDETIDIVKSYESEFSGRLKWVSEKDQGIYDAMNKGIKMASGDVVYGDIHFIRDGNPQKCIRYYSSRMFRPFWLRFGFIPAHPSFYCKREVYERAGGYRLDYAIGSDYDMMVRLFKQYKIVSCYINKDFVTMRTGGASTRNVQSRLTLIKENVRACRDNGIYTNELFICLKFFYKIFEFRI